jgi:hypothetical protein
MPTDPLGYGGRKARAARVPRATNIESGRYDPISGAVDYAIGAIHTSDVVVPSILDVEAGIAPAMTSVPLRNRIRSSQPVKAALSLDPQPALAMLPGMTYDYLREKYGGDLMPYGVEEWSPEPAFEIPGLPWGQYENPFSPGPWRVPDLPGGVRTRKRWSTGTAEFAIDELGNHWVMGKDGYWKKFRPSRPIVIGKAATRRNRSKIIRALKRFNKTTKTIKTSKTGVVLR